MTREGPRRASTDLAAIAAELAEIAEAALELVDEGFADVAKDQPALDLLARAYFAAARLRKLASRLHSLARDRDRAAAPPTHNGRPGGHK